MTIKKKVFLDNVNMISRDEVNILDHILEKHICTLACTKFFRCARTSIPNMEIMNKKYLIKTKNSKIIIFMRGGILSFSTDKG